MKVLIAVDMEGITGVANWDHVNPSHAEYGRFRKLMTEDVNAAIRGACAGGAAEVVVTDGHSNGCNVLIEHLDSRARLNSSSPSPFSMVQGIDQGVDAAMFVGYHARVGTEKAILEHTWSSTCVRDVRLNGKGMGEIGLNAAVCGHFGAPVLFISGDQAACSEAAQLLGKQIERVVVKVASGRFSAEVLPPAVTQPMIEAGAARAMEQWRKGHAPQPLRLSTPIHMEVELMHSEMLDRASILPGVERHGRVLEYTGETMPHIYTMFRSIATIARG